MRPRGSFGEVGRALLSAASSGPGTVREIAQRANVGYDVAAKCASRYLASGDLVRLTEGRPAVVTTPALAPAGETLGDHLSVLSKSFWEGFEADPLGLDEQEPGDGA